MTKAVKRTFSTYATNYFPRFGYGVVVVTDPVLRGKTTAVEIHAFFTQKGNTYKSFKLSFDGNGVPELSGLDLPSMALSEGEKHLCEILVKAKSIQYQAALHSGGLSLNKMEEGYLFQLHVRILIDAELEAKLEKHTHDQSLKSFMTLVSKAGRIKSVPLS